MSRLFTIDSYEETRGNECIKIRNELARWLKEGTKSERSRLIRRANEDRRQILLLDLQGQKDRLFIWDHTGVELTSDEQRSGANSFMGDQTNNTRSYHWHRLLFL